MRIFDFALIVISVLLIWLSTDIYDLSLLSGSEVDGNPVTSLGWSGGWTLAFWTLAVFVFHFLRFNHWGNTPPNEFTNLPPRNCTTFSRFFQGQLAYSFLSVMVFLLITFVPMLIENIRLLLTFFGLAEGFERAFKDPMMGGDASPLSWLTDAKPSEVAPYAAILMLVVLPRVGPADRVRQFFQERAATPLEAQRLIAQFDVDANAFSPEADKITQVVEKMTPFLSHDSFSSEVEGTKNVAILEYLMKQIASETSPNFIDVRQKSEFLALEADVVEIRNAMIDTFDRSCDVLGARAKDLDELEELADQIEDVQIKSAMAFALQLIKSLKNRYAEKKKVALRLAVTLTLASARSGKERQRQLCNLGIQLNPKSRTVPRMSLWLTFVTVLVVTLICTLIYTNFVEIFLLIADIFSRNAAQVQLADVSQSRFVPDGPNQILLWALIGGAMNMFAVLAGLLAWRLSGMPVERSGQRARFVDYIECFDHGFVFATAVNVLLFFMLGLLFGQRAFLQDNWHWTLMAGVTGAFLCVQGVNAKFNLIGRGVITALLQGVVAVAVGLFICWLWGAQPQYQGDAALGVFSVYVGIWSLLNGVAMGLLAMYFMRPTFEEAIESPSTSTPMKVVEAGA